jgi:hypothetical protein
MNWIEALQTWNSGNTKWSIPKKGSAEYNEVKKIQQKVAKQKYISPNKKNKMKVFKKYENIVNDPEFIKGKNSKLKKDFYIFFNVYKDYKYENERDEITRMMGFRKWLDGNYAKFPENIQKMILDVAKNYGAII